MYIWHQFEGIWHYVKSDSLVNYKQNLWLTKRWQTGCNLLSACDRWFSTEWTTAITDTWPDSGAVCRICYQFALREAIQERIDSHLDMLGISERDMI